MADFALLESPKLIPRKIRVVGKSWTFYTVKTGRLRWLYGKKFRDNYPSSLSSKSCNVWCTIQKDEFCSLDFSCQFPPKVGSIFVSQLSKLFHLVTSNFQYKFQLEVLGVQNKQWLCLLDWEFHNKELWSLKIQKYIKHGSFDLKHGLLDFKHGLLDFKHGLLYLKHGLLDFKHGLFDFKHGLLDLEYGLLDFKHRLLDFKHDLKDGLLDFKHT